MALVKRGIFGSIASTLDLIVIFFSIMLRGGSGMMKASNTSKCRRPEKTLVLYQFDGCPFCHKVMEAIGVLDLDVLIKPCPKGKATDYGKVGDSRFRQEAFELGGRLNFPLLVDPNTDVIMYESNDIVKYLWTQYGDRATRPISYVLGTTVFQWTVFVQKAMRMGHGTVRCPSNPPPEPITIYAFPNSPFCARVTEVLCELELEYLYISVPKGSAGKRKDFLRKYGHLVSSQRKSLNLIQVPLIVDPNNNDLVMVESGDIINYLRERYAA